MPTAIKCEIFFLKRSNTKRGEVSEVTKVLESIYLSIYQYIETIHTYTHKHMHTHTHIHTHSHSPQTQDIMLR